MRSAIEVQQARAFHDAAVPLLTPAEAFRMATSGAAEVLGKGSVLGTLDPGKEADLVEIDLAALLPHRGAFTDAGALDADTILSLLVHRGGPHAILRTFVRGRELDSAGRA
jgi:guanine deaminase